jgi:microcompartment protein CcmL/EutN
VLRAPAPYGPALGFLELRSIARGIVVCDALVKKAAVRLLVSEPVSPGKYLVLFDGGEAEVEEAFLAGLEAAKDALVDKLLLTNPHGQLWLALAARLERPALDSIAVVEAHSVAGTLAAADAAVKGGEVQLFQFQLAKGIGGKGWFAFSGVLDQVEAATQAATMALADGLLAGVEIVARPHEDLDGPAL